MSIEALHKALLEADSATAVLERLLGTPISIRRLDGPAIPPSPEQRTRLQLEDATPWVHRRVVLLSGGDILSEADLWYSPARLTPAMIEALATTNIPFGRVVQNLHPKRTTLLAKAGAPGSPIALEHHALLTAAGHPIAEVHERYVGKAFGQS